MNKNIKDLKENDLYSLSLFVLYKIIGIKEYSIVGEIPYILDKKNLLNFCKYFGGRTIKVPTLDEINSVLSLVLLYQYTKIDGLEYDDAIKLIGFNSTEMKRIKNTYKEICEILENYNFDRNRK